MTLAYICLTMASDKRKEIPIILENFFNSAHFPSLLLFPDFYHHKKFDLGAQDLAQWRYRLPSKCKVASSISGTEKKKSIWLLRFEIMDIYCLFFCFRLFFFLKKTIGFWDLSMLMNECYWQFFFLLVSSILWHKLLSFSPVDDYLGCLSLKYLRQNN